MNRSELLIGKIAEEMGFLTVEQLDSCVDAQAAAGPDVALGQILVERKLVTAEQLEDILAIQTERFREPDPHTFEKLEDILFGRLVVREGLVTEREVREALREQAVRDKDGKPEDFQYLGELLVERGLVKPEDVARVLKMQKKSILYCEDCLVQYNVADFSMAAEAQCRRCGGVLTAPPILRSVSVEGLVEEEESGAD